MRLMFLLSFLIGFNAHAFPIQPKRIVCELFDMAIEFEAENINYDDLAMMHDQTYPEYCRAIPKKDIRLQYTRPVRG